MQSQKLETRREKILRRAKEEQRKIEANSHWWFLVARVQLSKFNGEKRKLNVV